MKNTVDDASLVFEAGPFNDGSRISLDFGALGLRYEVAHALKRGLLAEMGHTSPDTQKKGFGAIRALSQYLHEAHLSHLCPLPIDLASNFADWLDHSTRGPSAQVALNVSCRLLAWCQRNIPGVISPHAVFWVRKIRDTNTPTRVAADPNLKKILEACYVEIGLIETRLEKAARVIAGQNLESGEEESSALIRELLVLGKGVLPKQRLVNRSGNSLSRRIEDQGGYRELAHRFWLCPEDLVPFYLAILTQTSGNPEAIKELSRDCVHQHPLRSDLERILWIKKRGAKEQQADFPSGRKWSAVSLVRRLMSLNADLVWSCGKRDQNKLFICYNPYFRTFGTPEKRYFLLGLAKLTQKYELPPFQFRDLRHAGAKAHHTAAGTILAAKNRLNHASIDSTLRYTELKDRAGEHDLLIRQFQGEMVRLSMGERAVELAVAADTARTSASDTVFGFTCKDPLGGLLPGSAKGTTCLQFSRCATCPGALIVLDDVNVVARLIATQMALEKAKKRSIAENWWPRFELLYEPTLQVLVTQVLPAVHPSIKARAAAIDVRRLIPVLE